MFILAGSIDCRYRRSSLSGLWLGDTWEASYLVNLGREQSLQIQEKLRAKTRDAGKAIYLVYLEMEQRPVIHILEAVCRVYLDTVSGDAGEADYHGMEQRQEIFVQFSLSCCSWQGAETGDAGEAVCWAGVALPQGPWEGGGSIEREGLLRTQTYCTVCLVRTHSQKNWVSVPTILYNSSQLAFVYFYVLQLHLNWKSKKLCSVTTTYFYRTSTSLNQNYS